MATITKVSASFGLTQSLPDYCNSKPTVMIEATLDAGDDAAQVRRDLLEQCRREVEAQVDLALEQAGRPARYSDEPRYKVLRSYVSTADKQAGAAVLFVLLPDELSPRILDDLHMSGANYYGEHRRLRLAMAQRVAATAVAEYLETLGRAVFVDCSSGDLSALEQAVADARPTRPVEVPVAAGAGADEYDDDDEEEYDDEESYEEDDDD